MSAAILFSSGANDLYVMIFRNSDGFVKQTDANGGTWTAYVTANHADYALTPTDALLELIGTGAATTYQIAVDFATGAYTYGIYNNSSPTAADVAVSDLQRFVYDASADALVPSTSLASEVADELETRELNVGTIRQQPINVLDFATSSGVAAQATWSQALPTDMVDSTPKQLWTVTNPTTYQVFLSDQTLDTSKPFAIRHHWNPVVFTSCQAYLGLFDPGDIVDLNNAAVDIINPIDASSLTKLGFLIGVTYNSTYPGKYGYIGPVNPGEDAVYQVHNQTGSPPLGDYELRWDGQSMDIYTPAATTPGESLSFLAKVTAQTLVIDRTDLKFGIAYTNGTAIMNYGQQAIFSGEGARGANDVQADVNVVSINNATVTGDGNVTPWSGA
jgi:hypothetical protein